MSALWPKFTKEKPCMACGHHDWSCRAGERKFLCMRIESGHPSKDGGWYHNYGDEKPVAKSLPKRLTMPKGFMDFEGMSNWMQKALGEHAAVSFAGSLGVSVESLKALKAGWSSESQAITIPMRDGDGKIIGIHLRCQDGSKKAVTGSRNGLFLPSCEPHPVVYLPEGASNTAALLSMGFYAIGRPSCNSGGDMLKACLKRLKINHAVIVADNDTEKTAPNGRKFLPGQDGALKLKKELGLMSVIFSVPSPLKDVRQLLNRLGAESAKNYISASVAMKIWTKA